MSAPQLPPTREPAEADLRDFLAASALSGLLAGLLNTSVVPTGTAQTVAASAYRIADAMLAARDGGPASIPLPRPARGAAPDDAA